MADKREGIIIADNKFQAVHYEDPNRPLNLIMAKADVDPSNKYIFIDTGILVLWGSLYQEDSRAFTPNTLKATYNGVTLFEEKNVRNVTNVVDLLNKFSGISKSDLDVLVKKVQANEKSDLEIAIEKLKKEKAILEQQIKIYKAIQTKKDEIKDLLASLDK